MVISLRQFIVCLILARNYNSPRTISVKVWTLPVAAEPTLWRMTNSDKNCTWRLEVGIQHDCFEKRFFFASRQLSYKLLIASKLMSSPRTIFLSVWSCLTTGRFLSNHCQVLEEFAGLLGICWTYNVCEKFSFIKIISIYYINTNEIPGELSCKNLISSHVKISPLLWLHHKSRFSHRKTIKMKWFGISLVFR